MLAILQFDFMIRALIVGVIAAITTAILGNFVVASRQSIMSDMIAHTSLAGVGLGIFFHLSPFLLAFAVSIVVSLFLWSMTRRKTHNSEAISILLLSGGLAIALLFSHLAKNNPVSFESYLFGSIITLTWQEVITFAFVSSALLITLFTFWNRFTAVIFDPDFARSRFKNSFIFEILFMLFIAVIVASSLKIIGGLLVGALLVIPVLSAQNTSSTFKISVLQSIFYSLLGVIAGVVISFYVDVPASSSIVLSLILLFSISSLPFIKTQTSN